MDWEGCNSRIAMLSPDRIKGEHFTFPESMKVLILETTPTRDFPGQNFQHQVIYRTILYVLDL